MKNFITFARNHGAKITQKDNGLWIVLDQPPASVLYWAVFETELNAATAYCFERGLLK